MDLGTNMVRSRVLNFTDASPADFFTITMRTPFRLSMFLRVFGQMLLASYWSGQQVCFLFTGGI
jgi:hypothetical protein